MEEIAIVNRIVREDEEVKDIKGERIGSALFLSVGIHPWYIENVEEQIEQLKNWAILPEVVALGEAGLDKQSAIPLDVQQEVFIRQAALAEESKKPLIVHCVKAWQELLEIKKQINPQLPWIIHGFRGKPKLAEQLIRQNVYISFGEYFHPESLHVAYPDRIFTETDDKAISIQTIYQQIASSLGISKEKLAGQIRRNVSHLFPGL
jgi:TatD DNase family protein